MTDDLPEVALTPAQAVVREAERIWFGDGTQEEKCAQVHELFERFVEASKAPTMTAWPGTFQTPRVE